MECYPGQRAEGESADALMEDLSDTFGYMRDSDTLKPHSTQATIKWLEQNYQLEDGVCLPRSTIYEHYLDFCERESIQPVNAASFGKIIRQQFPTLTTRRLGTRGQSKYHYYGLGIKQSSLYYTPDYIEKLNQGTSKKPQDTRKATYHEKPSAVLPAFPEVNSMTLSDKIPIDKLKTFMVMYRAHCQRILDSVVRANFNEVENFLLHFWQGMPTHMLPVLASDVVVDLVAHCDSLLYKVISNVLITSPLQNLPDSLASEIRKFSDMLQQWMEMALKGLPESLQEAKYKVADGFVNGLRRQTSLTKLAQVARGELRNNDCLEHLKHDWACLDMKVIYTQTLYAIEPYRVPAHYHQLLPLFRKQFDNLLNEQTDLEHFMFWTEDMIQSTVVKAYNDEHYPLKEACQAFLLTWKFFTSKILQEFTMENAPSFGFLILLHMLMDDYITHILESKLEKEDEKIYYSRIQEMKKDNQPVSTPSPVMDVPLPIRKSSPSLPLLSPTHDTPLLPLPVSEQELPQILSLPSLSLPEATPPLTTSVTASTIDSRSFVKSPSLSNPTGLTPPLSLDPLPPHLSQSTNRIQSLLPTDATMKGMATNMTASGADFSRSLSSTNLAISQPNYMLHPTPQLPSLAGHAQRQSNIDLYQQSNLPATPLQSFYSTATHQPHPSQRNPPPSTHQPHPSQQRNPPPSNQPHPSQQRNPPTSIAQMSSAIISHAIAGSHQTGSNYGTHVPVMSTDVAPLSSRMSSVMTSSAHQLGNAPSINQSFRFNQRLPQQPQTHPQSLTKGGSGLSNMLPDLSHNSGTAGYIGRTNTPSTMVTPSIPSFAALNVPFGSSSSAHSVPTSSTLSNSANNLPLFPGIYQYAPFVGIPAPMNAATAPFAQTGLQMPGQPGAMAAAATGYPYLPGVSPSLYSTQVTSNSFTR